MDQAAEIIESPQSHRNIDHEQPPVHPKSQAKIYFSLQDNMQLTELPFVLMLFLTVLTFGLAVFSLGFLTYDYQGLLSVEKGTFLNHLSKVTAESGLVSPLGVLFNLSMYQLATKFLGWTHVFVFAAHAFSAVLLAIMISRKYTRIESALFGILYLTLPMFTGQYGWFAQGNITIALFVLMLQLFIIQSTRLDLIVKSAFLVILQIVAILLHESLLFSFIPILLFLLPSEKPYFGSVHLRTLVLLCIPTAIYLVLKIFVVTPHSITDFFQKEVVMGFASFFDSTSSLVLHSGQYLFFWIAGFLDGVYFITHTDIAIFFIVGFVALLIYEIAVFFTHRFADGNIRSPLVNPLFWLMLGLCTCVPFNASAMGFPIFCFIVAILQLIRLFSRRVGIAVACVLIFSFLPISLGLLTQMKNQANRDSRHLNRIIETIETKEIKEKVAISISNPPQTNSIFPFQRYMTECISLPECLYPALERRSDKVSSTSTKVLPFTYDSSSDELVQ